jgi:Fe-S-cluster containining protein
MKNNPKQANFKPLLENTFKFRCYKGIECFTKCCADLKLVLTPHDILKMKNRLGISSDNFLDKYTDQETDSTSRFPMVRLKMNRDAKKSCPFVSPDGCTIYEDRPGACRIYPLGRAATKPDVRTKALEKFFLVVEDHCLGFQEDREWTVDEWMKHEGIHEYNAMNDPWLEIITSQKSLGPEKDHHRKMQMFFMASYNLDRFREFLFKSSFFELFDIDPDAQEDLATDDVALMQFAFKWLNFSLFGDKTMQIKSQKANA